MASGVVAGTDRDFVRSLAKGIAVLRSFSAEQSSLTVAELARSTGLSRTAVHRILSTLVTLGYLQVSGRHYRPAARMLDLGYATASSGGIAGVVQPHLDDLDRVVRESCSVGVLVGGDVVYVARAQARRPLSIITVVGSRFPAASTAIGRAMLSGLEDGRVRNYLALYPPVAFTHLSMTDPEALLEEVRAVRQRGWAVTDEELELGYRAVAVPLRGADGSVVAAVNVRMSVGRITWEQTQREVLPLLRQTATRIERDLALHPMPFNPPQLSQARRPMSGGLGEP